MKHLMIDIEAMDDKPTAAITAIAAIFFNPETGEIGESFSRRISLEDSMSKGGTVSAEVILRCLRQPVGIRRLMFDDFLYDIDCAICDFYDFVNSNMPPLGVRVLYGCPSLRSAVLRTAMQKFVGDSFEYGNEQSVTTVNELAKSLGLNMESIIPNTRINNAYDQVVYNIKIVSYVWMYLMKIASVK
ncbi:3'-5' exoribonuclease [Salmonella enterica subsp. enterica serovar Typhimurium]|nr:3'-5' exoribonuclease [Salmonella enterica subsp. enterica serovar Typhimurium]